MLNRKEIKRYNRQIILDEVGLEGQEKLKAAKVLVIGAGGLGCPVIQYLAATGIGTIGIVDNDIVDESNLQRQILYSLNDLGLNKAKIAAQKIIEINPLINVIPFPEKLSKDNALSLIKDFDIVIDGSDNFSTRYLVNDACIILNKSFVSASLNRFEAQLSVFNYQGGPSYRCLFPEPPTDAMNCTDAGVLGYLTGIIGTLQAGEVIKMILRKGEILSGKLLIFDALKMEFNTVAFEKTSQAERTELESDYDVFCSANNDRSISSQELRKMIENNEILQLVDVREQYEFDEFNLKGSLHIPLNTLPGLVNKISKKDKVVVLCAHGIRSQMAIEYLKKEHNFQNLYNLGGGLSSFSSF